MENQRPRPGDFYRHFKGKIYQIITIALDSETLEECVVYQALYDDFKTYVRPLSMFMSLVDKDKYPDTEATFRFEPVTLELVDNSSSDTHPKPDNVTDTNYSVSEPETILERELTPEEIIDDLPPMLIAFLDAPTYHKKLEVFEMMHKSISTKLLCDIATSLDLSGVPEDKEDAYYYIKKNLETEVRFERLGR